MRVTGGSWLFLISLHRAKSSVYQSWKLLLWDERNNLQRHDPFWQKDLNLLQSVYQILLPCPISLLRSSGVSTYQAQFIPPVSCDPPVCFSSHASIKRYQKYLYFCFQPVAGEPQCKMANPCTSCHMFDCKGYKHICHMCQKISKESSQISEDWDALAETCLANRLQWLAHREWLFPNFAFILWLAFGVKLWNFQPNATRCSFTCLANRPCHFQIFLRWPSSPSMLFIRLGWQIFVKPHLVWVKRWPCIAHHSPSTKPTATIEATHLCQMECDEHHGCRCWC